MSMLLITFLIIGFNIIIISILDKTGRNIASIKQNTDLMSSILVQHRYKKLYQDEHGRVNDEQ